MNKKAFTVLVATMFISMLAMGVLSPILPVYAGELGASSLEVGLVQGGFSLSGILTMLFVGRLSDRFGRKNFLCAGLIVLTLSSLGLVWAQNPAQLIVVRVIQGFGASAHLPIAHAYLGDITPEGDEGKWMGYFNAVLFAGLGFGPLLGGVLTDIFSADTTFLTMAVLNALGLVATLVCLKEMPRKVARREHSAILAPFKSRIINSVLLQRMTAGFGTSTLMAFMPLFADARLGLSASLIGILLAARTPVSLVQSYTGRLSDRVDRRGLVIWGTLASVAAIALLPSTGGFWTLLLVYVLVTLGQAFAMPAANAYMVDEGRTYGMGVCMTWFMMAMQTGNGIGPIFLGAIADWFNLEAAFYTSAILMAIGIIPFMWMMRGISGKQTPAP